MLLQRPTSVDFRTTIQPTGTRSSTEPREIPRPAEAVSVARTSNVTRMPGQAWH